jgi:hypothetical protein
LRPLLAQARELRSGKTQPPSEENIEANISLAERLWQASENRCPGAGNQDRALRLVVENLSR